MIVAVAIRYGDKVWSLPQPNRHHHIRSLIYEETGSNEEEDSSEEGFLDDSGRFLNRYQALRVARKNKQLRPEIPIRFGELYSENLW